MMTRLMVAAVALMTWASALTAQPKSPLSPVEKQRLIDQKGARWIAGTTSFSGLPIEEGRRWCGGQLDENTRPRTSGRVRKTTQFPAYFDWRNIGGTNWMTPIRTQGGCGSCWAFAGIAAMEAKMRIFWGTAALPIDLSEQYLLSCSDGTCQGWYLSSTCDFLRDEGATDELCFPHQFSDAIPCDDRCDDWWARIRKVSAWDWVNNDVEDIKSEIYNYGPVATWMGVYEDFWIDYTGGVYEHVYGDWVGGHFVVIVGWNDNDPDGACWICKNSWGSENTVPPNNWGEDTYGIAGEKGWFRIKMGVDEVGIEGGTAWLDPEPLPNLVAAYPSGWANPLVPRGSADASETWCPVPSTLPGNASETFVNWSWKNAGTVNAQGHGTHGYIDGVYSWWSTVSYLPPDYTIPFVNLGPFFIRGGRHTLQIRIDIDDQVWESNENDNAYTRQYVWSPLNLAMETPISRPCPPDRGSLSYPNCDGFSFTRSGPYAYGIGIIPTTSDEDYDLMLFTDYSESQSGFSVWGAGSYWLAGKTDFVVATFTGVNSTVYPGVYRYSGGSDNFYIEGTDSWGQVISLPSTLVDTLAAHRILNLYEAFLYDTVTYSFNVDNMAGNADLGISLYGPYSGYYGKSEFAAYRNSQYAGGDESFDFLPDTSGWHIMAVWKDGYTDENKAAMYSLSVSLSTESIAVTSPNGRENWEVGSTPNITWNSQDFVGNVKIEYTTDFDSPSPSWWTVVSSTPNDGIHPWAVPNVPSAACRIQVSDAADGTPWDISDGNFVIYTPPASSEWSILFDETHGIAFDWFSGYCAIWDLYTSLARLLIDEGYSVSSLTTSLTYPSVSPFDVLVFILPQEEFTTPELNAIDQFLADGKEVVAVGDWEGWGPANVARPILNDLFAHFGAGIQLIADDVRDSTDNDGFVYWPIISDFADHPTVDGLDSVILYAGSSVNATSPGMVVAWGDDDSYTMPGSQWRGVTSSVLREDPGRGKPSSVADVPAMAISETGGGRWFAVGDASLWCNFEPHFDGVTALDQADNAQLALNVFGWTGELPSFIVTSPNGGEDWEVGSEQTITWESTGSMADVAIEYTTNGGANWDPITLLTVNDGSHPWTVPNTPSTDCFVRIYDPADGDPHDMSDGPFTISRPPALTVVSPNGRENWEVGSVHDITWSSENFVGSIAIEYSVDAGATWTSVLDGTSNDGIHSWTVPDVPSTSCRVRVSDDDDGDPFDVSDQNFVIYAPTDVAELAILFDETHGYAYDWVSGYYAIWDAYASLAHLLIEEGFSVSALTDSLTYSAIASYDVLVLVLPQEPYDPTELDVLDQFLSDGKEMVFIGDWGSWAPADTARPVLNQVLSTLGSGIQLSDDAVYDSTDHDGRDYWPVIQNFQVPHPVTSDLEAVVPYFTSSLSTVPPAMAIAWGDDDSYTESYPQSKGVRSSGVLGEARGRPSSTGYVPVMAVSEASGGYLFVMGDANIWDGWEPHGDGVTCLDQFDNAQLALNVFGWPLTSVEEEAPRTLPDRYALFNSPNPFNPATQICYSLPCESWVTIEVYNLLGQRIVALVDGKQPAGHRSVQWAAGDAASGLYLCRIVARGPGGEDFVATRKMALIR